jgi:hypothetical protein
MANALKDVEAGQIVADQLDRDGCFGDRTTESDPPQTKSTGTLRP